MSMDTLTDLQGFPKPSNPFTLSGETVSIASGVLTTNFGPNQNAFNCMPRADSTIAFSFGETAAAVGGTSTSGIPNQVIGKFSTLAGSTASALSVYSRGSHVFSVAPAFAQIYAASGSVNNPTYSFAADSTAGMWLNSAGDLRLGVGGGGSFTIKMTNTAALVPTGIAARPGLSDFTTNNTGLTWLASNTMSISNVTDGEWIRFISFGTQFNQAGANATAYALNVRKARGTVSSPTVITTADVLSTFSGYGYVGSTNTYLEGTRISSVSAGTITDATTGLGGQLRFLTAKQSVDAGPVERLRLDDFGHLVSVAGTANTPTINTCTNGAITGGTDNAMLITFSGANTTCSINFGTTWTTNAPICTASSKTVAGSQLADVATTTSLLTITPSAAYANTDTVQVLCIGRL